MNNKIFKLAKISPIVAAILSSPALAASSGGSGGLPWESPLQKFLNSMDGPVAYGVSIIAIVVTGITLVWGGEISEFARRFIYAIIVISLIALATSVYSSFYSSGAVFF